MTGKSAQSKSFAAGKVSAVTPVYNGASHLAGMLDSVLGQTYPDLEMILVDDGSSDGTLAVAERYRERFAARGYGYRIVRSDHRFAAGAINRGLPYVRGEFLIWPDSDDFLEPESVARRVAFLREHPAYHCVRSLSYYFDAKTGRRLNQADEKTGDLSKEDLFWDILESKTFVCCGCYMLESRYFFEIYPDRRIPEYPVGQNFQMLLPFMYRHRCPTIQEQLYGVCVRPGSHSRTPLTREQEERKYLDFERLIDDIERICRIRDRASRDRLTCWKLRRRYYLFLRHDRKEDAQAVRKQLLKLEGGVSSLVLLKDALWRCVEHNWLGTWLSPRRRQLYAGSQRLWQRCRRNLRAVCRRLSRDLGQLVQRLHERAARPDTPIKIPVAQVSPCKKKAVALTFDEGFGHIDRILDALRRNRVRATFFITGGFAEKDPQLCRRILDDGHELGNHSYRHPAMTELPDEAVLEEIRSAQRLLMKDGARDSRLFRFPYGAYDQRLLQLVDQMGFLPVSWAINTRDWEGISTEQICQNVLEAEELSSGAIILMHTQAPNTGEALDLLIPRLRAMGYEPVRVSDLLNASPPYRRKWKELRRRKTKIPPEQ